MKPPCKPKNPLQRDYTLSAEPGVFTVTGAEAETEKLRGFADIFLRDVADRIAAAETLLRENKLTGVERHRFEDHLAALKKNTAELAARGTETPSFEEMNKLYRSILTLGNFGFRQQDRDFRARVARGGFTSPHFITSSATKPSVLIGIGVSETRFREFFEPLGHVTVRKLGQVEQRREERELSNDPDFLRSLGFDGRDDDDDFGGEL